MSVPTSLSEFPPDAVARYQAEATALRAEIDALQARYDRCNIARKGGEKVSAAKLKSACYKVPDIDLQRSERARLEQRYSELYCKHFRPYDACPDRDSLLEKAGKSVGSLGKNIVRAVEDVAKTTWDLYTLGIDHEALLLHGDFEADYDTYLGDDVNDLLQSGTETILPAVVSATIGNIGLEFGTVGETAAGFLNQAVADTLPKPPPPPAPIYQVPSYTPQLSGEARWILPAVVGVVALGILLAAER